MNTSSGVLPGAGAEAGHGAVDAVGPRRHRRQGVGYAHGKVVVAVEADLHLRG